jgi:DNA-binding response OmpR family regulator
VTAAGAPQTAPMTTAASVRPGRILLVEDDHDAARYAVHVLTTVGRFDVAHTTDPRVALDRASSEPWDLVLTDLDLPGMTGLELLAALREVTPVLPVAVLTAELPEGAALGQLLTIADACLEKPVLPGRLVAAVTALITETAPPSH